MNRLKLWVFSLVAAGAAFAALRAAAVSRRADAIAALDARLASAAAHVGTSFRDSGREAAALAAVAARDPALAAALRPQETPSVPAPATPKGKKPAAPPTAAPADPGAEDARERDAARAALAAAEKSLGLELPAGASAAAASRDALARKVEGAAPEGEVTAYLRTAAGGAPRRGWVRQGGGLYLAAAVPAGDGGALAVLVPFDEAWAKALSTAAGADVTVVAPDVKGASTARPADVPSLQGVTRQAGAADAGRVADVELAAGPVRLPPLPQPIAGGWSLRARAVPLENVKGGFVVLSVSAAAAAAAAPAVFLWSAVLGIVVFLLASLALGFLIRSTEGPPQVPEELLAAAARIERGDFAARVPPLAGKLGTVGAALNRAAEIAGPAQAARAAPEEWFQQAAARAVVPGSAAAAIPGPAAGAPMVAVPPAAPAPAAAPRTATGMLSAVSAPVSGDPFAVADEEAHWQQVFQDFLRTRASCGESTEGLAYEKFRVKLEGNKAQLVAKYGCKTVRFQVYVKEGKAALKATPVK